MAERNMEKIIEGTRVPDRYDMTLSELGKLVHEAPPDAVYDAYKFGFAEGMRCQRKGGMGKDASL